nr:immunoglobulin light chain junction region [Macaca mulatta]
DYYCDSWDSSTFHGLF